MATTLLDMRHSRGTPHSNLPGLNSYLAQLIGEPFRFARVSFGDELTLHFGELRPARSVKLKNHSYGAYILGLRASSWLLKAGFAPLVLSSGIDTDHLPGEFGEPIRKEEIEANPLILPGSRVHSATAFPVEPMGGFGLQLGFTDGSALHIFPGRVDLDEPEDEALPELADWELLSPGGLLRAGPGLNWSFKASS